MSQQGGEREKTKVVSEGQQPPQSPSPPEETPPSPPPPPPPPPPPSPGGKGFKGFKFLRGSNFWRFLAFVFAALFVVTLIISIGLYLSSASSNNYWHNKYEDLLSQYNTLMTDYSDMQSQYNSLETNYTTLKSQYNSLYNQYQSLQSQYTNLQSQYNALQSQYTTLESNYTALKVNYNSLQNQYSSLQSQYSALESNYSNLQSRYNSLYNTYYGVLNWLGSGSGSGNLGPHAFTIPVIVIIPSGFSGTVSLTVSSSPNSVEVFVVDTANLIYFVEGQSPTYYLSAFGMYIDRQITLGSGVYYVIVYNPSTASSVYFSINVVTTYS